MCLLVVYRSGAMPDPDALARAAVRNPDGFGWAIHTGAAILTHRTMCPAEGVASFVAARAEHPHGPALWHARYTTHGVSDVTNVHPFPVNGDPDIVVAHNGVLPIVPTGTRSDTHEFARSMLRADDLDSPGAMYWLGEWAAGSKLAILSASPATRESLYIVNEQAGEWSSDEPGVWYSNTSHRPMVAPTFSADPRKSGKSGKSAPAVSVATGWGELAPAAWDDDDDRDGFDPWEFYDPTDGIVECPEPSCGELWPGVCQWCEQCGADLSGEHVSRWDDELTEVRP